MDDRAAAALALNLVLKYRRTSDQVLGSLDSPAARDYFFGSLRHYFAICSLLDPLIKRPIAEKHQDIYCLLIVGAYQLIYGRTPEHAALHATVQACQELKKDWAKGLINGVLRNLQRQCPINLSTEQSYPSWFANLIDQGYPGKMRAVLAALLQRAPQAVRVNLKENTVEAYCALLKQAGINYSNGYTKATLVLNKAVRQQDLPAFYEGKVSTQDAGASLVTELLPLKSGQRLLDTCAAPGGKLFALMEATPKIQATAVEVSSRRVAYLASEADRLGHSPTILEGDSTSTEWWDGTPFDAILVDAPCSGSGTVRRHPEILILQEIQRLRGYQQQQLRLLANAWQTLKPGGLLLYCTCSVFETENDDVIKAFLADAREASVVNLALPTGNPTDVGWQLLPTDYKTDGFYYALLKRAE